MSMYDLQKEVHEWVEQYKVGYWDPMGIMVRLSEETGELAKEVSHRWGPKKKKSEEEKKEVGDEMADIIFTLCCMANSLDINLDEHFKSMMDKLNSRDKDRWEKKD